MKNFFARLNYALIMLLIGLGFIDLAAFMVDETLGIFVLGIFLVGVAYIYGKETNE